MGDILYCTDNHLKRPVVMKLLKSSEEDRRLIDEQKALIQLRSKHVVELFDVVNVTVNNRNKAALVLEHIDGNDLKPDSYDEDEHYLRTLWQIACGLKDIHKSGVIHRDIKPNNIRQDANGVIKIFDFGLARSTNNAKTGIVIGTIGYMAPELWQRTTPIKFDQSIDVYAFGLTALHLLGVNVPAEFFYQPPMPIVSGWLDNRLIELPTKLTTMIEKCLSYNAENRPQIVEVEALLKRYLLENSHKALIVMNGSSYELSEQSPTATVRFGIVGSITIHYDGLDFKVTTFEDIVTINNQPVKNGQVLFGASVITIGNGNNRAFATFDISNPEVLS
jgi:serine/threonine protein kinase